MCGKACTAWSPRAVLALCLGCQPNVLCKHLVKTICKKMHSTRPIGYASTDESIVVMAKMEYIQKASLLTKGPNVDRSTP